MFAKSFAFCLFLSILFPFDVTADKVPIAGKFYLIKSGLNSGYLKPVGDGKICKSLSRLATMKEINSPTLFTWELKQMIENVYLYSAQSEGYMINELTMDEYPPYCYLIYRHLEFISHNYNSYIIKSNHTEKCLYNSGMEVSWTECGTKPNHLWSFEESPINQDN